MILYATYHDKCERKFWPLTHNRHHIACPEGQAMWFQLWVFQRKLNYVIIRLNVLNLFVICLLCPDGVPPKQIFMGLRSIWPSNQLGVTVAVCGYRADWSSRIIAGMLGAIEREIVVEDRQLIKWSTIDMDLLDFCTKRLLSPAVILQTPFSTPLV